MCGIVSIVSAAGPVTPERLKRATDAIAHRGPDGEGFWHSTDRRTALGHRRLSIIGLDSGAQPLCDEAQTVYAVVNGEFYGFEDIRADLQRLGHRFLTQSDSEIAVHLYKQYGMDFVHHLRGEFALVIHDVKANKIIAARDRFGIKPLCYAQSPDGTFYIASEAKAIFAAGFNAAWDEYSFLHSCAAQYTPQDRTLFAGVSQLKPGHMLVFGDSQFKIDKYWDFDYATTIAQRSDADWIEDFRTTFDESVRLRLRADVPLCFHLSGGLDSSAVAATARQIYQKPMDAFTVRFDVSAYDEYPQAQEMANHLGFRLHAVDVSQNDIVAAIPDAVYYSEGLSINGHLAGKFLLNRAIQNAGFKVALTGEGADELLAGYPHFREDMIAGDNEKKSALYASNEKLAGVFLAHGETLPTREIEVKLGYLPSFLKAKASLGLRVSSLLSDNFQTPHDYYKDMAASFDIKGQLAGRSHVNQSSYLWSKLALANYILRTLGDGCEMAQSIEGRVPFLDHKLFELTRAMPDHIKIRDMTEKFVLREAMRDRITDAVYKRQKHPFIAPPVSRAASPALDAFIQDHLRSADFKTMRFFDQNKVITWLDALDTLPQQDRVAAEPVLMMLLTSLFIQKSFKLS